MRSFFLKDLLSVTPQQITTQITTHADDQMKSNAPDIWPKADIAKRFDVNEKEVEPSWPFSFQLEFRDRNFRLSARTR